MSDPTTHTPYFDEDVYDDMDDDDYTDHMIDAELQMEMQMKNEIRQSTPPNDVQNFQHVVANEHAIRSLHF